MSARNGLRPYRRGEYDPTRQGRGPKRGAPNAGRPSDAFREMCRELVRREEVLKAVSKILKNSDHPLFMQALNWATNHGYGKPEQTVNAKVSDPEGRPLRIIYEHVSVGVDRRHDATSRL